LNKHVWIHAESVSELPALLAVLRKPRVELWPPRPGSMTAVVASTDEKQIEQIQVFILHYHRYEPRNDKSNQIEVA
jgi:hypothetical protein